MPKSEKNKGTNSFGSGYSGRPPAPDNISYTPIGAQGNSGGTFILPIIMLMFFVIFSGEKSDSVTTAGIALTAQESASGLVADSDFKHTPAKTVSHNELSGELSSLSPDSFILDADFADTIVDKLWQRESSRRLNPLDGDGGDAVGPLQLHIGVLIDVNKYYGTNFTPQDRRDYAKSRQIALMYINMWLNKNVEEIAVRIFNGGPRGWQKKTTDAYWDEYKKLKVNKIRN
jgi:hypothetical protein